MENELVKAVFEKKSCRLISLINKKTGREMIKEPSCYFRYADENPVYGMTSWRVGPYMTTRDLNAECGVRFTALATHPLYCRIVYEMSFGESRLTCTVTLKKDSPVLEFDTCVDWSEAAVHGQKIPQISFAVPVGYDNGGEFSADIPYGVIKRKQLAHDIPALSYICADNENGSLALMTDTKYGCRYYDNVMSVTLIRSAYNPDPYPERGIHNIRIGVAVCEPEQAKDISKAFCSPIAFLSATKHGGSLPLKASALSVSGDAVVSCVKNSEDGEGVTVRLYNTDKAEIKEQLSFFKAPAKAYICQSDEKTRLGEAEINGKSVLVNVPAYGTVTVTVYF